jgi:hypothetical protein
VSKEHTHTYAHEHEHEHNHADDCSCGCGCGHEHAHGHAHGHDYDHAHGDHGHAHGDHHHDHQELTPGVVDLQNHEGAQVATLQEFLQGDFKALESMLSAWLKALAQSVIEAEGIVGHIKASLSDGSSVSTLSTTDGNVNITQVATGAGSSTDQTGADSDTQLTLVAIIFNIDGDLLSQMVIDSKP